MNESSDADRPVLIAGLPASGKTTFLAALWHVVANSGQSRFSVHGFDGNREYVNQIEQAWLAVAELPRTPRDQVSHVYMNVEDRLGGSRFAISLPDLSGEDFLKFFARREWPLAFDDLVGEASGLLLFVNPANVVTATTLGELEAAAAAVDGASAPEPVAQSAKATEWDVEKAPTAVILVDLLHEMSEKRHRSLRPLRVALIVSAWDTMRDLGVTPEDWVRRDLALLHQYLLTNPDRFQCRIFGVSAQGGDVRNQQECDRLRAFVDARDRVEVVEPEAFGKDLSVPIAWVTA